MIGLMQIAEPGMSTAPHRERLAVGIDLGTTNSLVATVVNGSPEVIPDSSGAVLLPSVVRYFEDGSTAVGLDAAEGAGGTVISSVKRLIGRSKADFEGRRLLPYSFAEGGGMVKIHTVAGVKSPVEVSGEVLRILRMRAESRLGGELVGAVITVPAYFDDAQRQATKDAGKLAGLNVMRLLNEPTAAALAYGLDSGAEGLYMVYDLGGGTFDVSLLKLTRGVFEVLATGGDTALGGDDFDLAVAAGVLEAAGIAEPADGSDRRRLLMAARGAREELTTAERTELSLTLGDGTHVACSLTREEFDRLSAGLVSRTIEAVRRVLADARISREDIHGVVLVGGATRMPCIRAAVAGFFGRAPFCGIDPDQVVAVGAAIQANKLAGNSAGNDWLLLDVTPLSLGIETMGGLAEKVIPRNTPIPVAMAQDFTTFRDGQTAMAIHVVQGEREVVDACRSLARFELRGIPPMAAGAARIRVTFQLDADGILSVSAREQHTGRESSVTVKPSYGLSDEEVIRMLKDGTASAERDRNERELREQRVEAGRLIEAVVSALSADGDLLSAEEKRDIDEKTAALAALADSGSCQAIRDAAAALTAATGEFAARRMDRTIRKALAGCSIDAVGA